MKVFTASHDKETRIFHTRIGITMTDFKTSKSFLCHHKILSSKLVNFATVDSLYFPSEAKTHINVVQKHLYDLICVRHSMVIMEVISHWPGKPPAADTCVLQVTLC